MESLLIFFRVGPFVALALMVTAWKVYERWGPDSHDAPANVATVVSCALGYVGLAALLFSGFAFSVWGEPW